MERTSAGPGQAQQPLDQRKQAHPRQAAVWEWVGQLNTIGDQSRGKGEEAGMLGGPCGLSPVSPALSLACNDQDNSRIPRGLIQWCVVEDV